MDQPPQLRAAANANAVKLDNRIAGFDSCLGRGAVLLDSVDDGPGDGRQLQFLRLLRGHVAQSNAQVNRAIVQNKDLRRFRWVRGLRWLGWLRRFLRVRLGVRRNLRALQDGGVDAVMFSNEASLPYLTKVEPITTITIITRMVN